MKPLAERMRPKNMEMYIGQDHLMGAAGVVRKMIINERLHSFILWGPPGVGKTSLAKLISEELDIPFYTLSAINAGVKDIRQVIDRASKRNIFEQAAPILFIDEIHRFSKSQQDALLGAVETGVVTLIGATTENPSFEVISALLSRCQVYVLKPLTNDQLKRLIDQALYTDAFIKSKGLVIKEYEALIHFAGGDARKVYNNLEITIAQLTERETKITNEIVTNAIQQKSMAFDKSGEMHYDVISAFIKSIRGSDPDAAVYWLARMIEGGEDEKFICRRMVILAAEDIGLANPNALLVATQCMQAVKMIGYPEARIIMSQAAIYLAASPKSNSAYAAIGAAQKYVRNTGDLSVPMHLRNAPTKLMKDLDYGKDYKYAHDFEHNFADQTYLPKGVDPVFYNPGRKHFRAQIERSIKIFVEGSLRMSHWTINLGTSARFQSITNPLARLLAILSPYRCSARYNEASNDLAPPAEVINFPS